MDSEGSRKEATFGGAFLPWRWILTFPLGFMMFLYLGWVYQASWYWYYGINPTQLNLPLSDILQQSIVSLYLSLSLILIIFGVIFLLRLIVLSIRNLFPGQRVELSSLFSLRDLFQRSIHLIALIYVGLIYEFLVQVDAHNPGHSDLEMPASIAMLDLFIIPIAAILFLRLLGDLLCILPAGLKQRLHLEATSRIQDEHYRLLLSVLAMFTASMLFIGNMGVGDASVGFRNNASYQAVRQVYLESSLPIVGLERYLQCSCSPYIYGPMGYLGNNQEYIFLVPWKADGQTEFPQFPSLYQIERSPTNPINIIPDGLSPQGGQESEISTMWERQTKSQ